MDGCCGTTTQVVSYFSLSDSADVAQVFIALVNLIFVFVFFYKQHTDSKIANTKNVRLQWFKELIMQPNIPVFNLFFTDIENLRQQLIAPGVTTAQYQEIGRLIRLYFSKFRKKFHEPLLNIDRSLYLQIKTIIEDLDVQITNAMLNNTHDFTDDIIFEDNVVYHLLKAKTDILTAIINFEG